MEQRTDEINNIEMSEIEQEKPLSRLPIVALLFSFGNIILHFLSWLPLIGLAFAYIFFMTGWGALFQIIGIILAIVSLRKGMKRIGTSGLIISIVSIIFPFVWWLITLALYKEGSIELFI